METATLISVSDFQNSLYQDILSPQLIRFPILLHAQCTESSHLAIAYDEKNTKVISYEMSVLRLVTATTLVINIFRDI